MAVSAYNIVDIGFLKQVFEQFNLLFRSWQQHDRRQTSVQYILIPAVVFVTVVHRHKLRKGKRLNMQLIAASTELRNNIP